MTHEITRNPKPFQRADIPFRTPRRISITLPYEAYQRLLDRSNLEGRSLSNLASFLLESAIREQHSQGFQRQPVAMTGDRHDANRRQHG